MLQRIKDTKDSNNNNNGNKDDDDSDSDIYLDKNHNWSQQIAWEDTHLGGFRRIMPCPADKNRYQKFHVQQNQLSVYSETAASKRREECAKQQRIELEEKFKHNQSILKQFRFSKNVNGEDDVVKKKKTKKNKRNYFKPDDIGENDERDRCTSLSQREYLIKSCGMLQAIYVNFHRSQILTESDKRKYRELFAKLIGSNEMTSLPILSGIQSKTKVIKGPTTNQYPISMPTNLNPLIAQEMLSNQNDASSALPSSNEATTTSSGNSNWVHDVPITFRSQLPSLPHARVAKANLARQVTNVIKRHNGQQITDKII